MSVDTTPRPTRMIRIDGLPFHYDDAVLAPRPWTLAQAEWARELLADAPAGDVLEVCSGVGHIGLLSLLGNERRLVTVDVSEAACRFAATNASAAGLTDRVEIRRGTMTQSLDPAARFALVIADPPWVPSEQVTRFPEDPVGCIDGGEDGLVLARECLEVAGRHLLPGGSCLLQVGPDQLADLERWLAGRTSLPLSVVDSRRYERGTVVRLDHTTPGSEEAR